jgi:hypothetical protein
MTAAVIAVLVVLAWTSMSLVVSTVAGKLIKSGHVDVHAPSNVRLIAPEVPNDGQ